MSPTPSSGSVDDESGRSRSGATEDVLRELDRLEAESRARLAELRRIAAELPATMSRRALATALVRDARATPNKGAIARRGVLRIGRMPVHMAHRARNRWRARER